MAGYDMEYQQLSRGYYRGRHSVARIGSDVSVNLERNNRTLIQSAVTPYDQYTLYFILNESAHTRLNGALFTHNHVFLCGPRTTWDTVDLTPSTPADDSPLGPHYAALSFDEAFFESQVLGCRSDSKVVSALRNKSLHYEDRKALGTLKNKVSDLMKCIEGNTDKGAHFAVGVRNSVAEILSDYIRNRLPFSAPSRRGGYSKPYRVVKRVREHIESQFDAEVSINLLCRDMNVSRRMLEYYFQDQMGVSPMAYLRSVRLNETRRQLSSDDHAHRSVGDIAAEFGFWHPSRFATYYRDQFGEMPSETRSRVF